MTKTRQIFQMNLGMSKYQEVEKWRFFGAESAA